MNVNSFLQKRRPKITEWLTATFSSLLYITDMFTDFYLGIAHMRSNDISWAVLTFLFCFVPWLIQLFWGLAWSFKRKNPRTKRIGMLFSVLNLHVPHAEFYKVYKMKKHTDYELAEEKYDCLKLKETIRLCEDMPQLIIQLHVIGRKNEMSANAFYSIVTSFVGVVVVGAMLKVNKEKELEKKEREIRKREESELRKKSISRGLVGRFISCTGGRDSEVVLMDQTDGKETKGRKSWSDRIRHFSDWFKNNVEIYLTYIELRRESKKYLRYQKIRDRHPPLCFHRFFRFIREKYPRTVKYLVLVPYHLILALTSIIAISLFSAVGHDYWPIAFFAIPWYAAVVTGKLRRKDCENTYITLGTVIACAIRLFESLVINFFLAGWFITLASALTSSGNAIINLNTNLTTIPIVPTFVWPDTLDVLKFMKYEPQINGTLPSWANCSSSMLNKNIHHSQFYLGQIAEFLEWIWYRPICVTDHFVLVYQTVFVSSIILPIYELFIVSLL